MTGQQVILDLLRFIGVTGFTAVENDQRLNRPGLDDDDTSKAFAAVNGALNTIYEHGPQSMKEGERAAFFNPQTPLVISAVAAQGQSATASTTPPAWMLGCSVLLSGDSDLNRIMDITGNDLSLLRGYRGPTGATTATVYADCATLGPDIAAVLEPVMGSQDVNGLVSNRRLLPAKDRADFTRFQRNEGVAYRQIGVPSHYLVERRRGGDLFLRVTPMPSSSFNATFQAKLNPEQITEDVIDPSGGPDPGYEFTTLRSSEVTGLLLPIARWLFFAHPALKNAETRQNIKLQYDAVMLKLTNGTAFEPSVQEHHAEYI